MSENGKIAIPAPEEYRNYLLLLARGHLDPRLRRTMDASDVVQETMIRALNGWDQFRGESDGERRAWLRATLFNFMTDKIREVLRRKRDPGGDRLDHSLTSVLQSMAMEQSSPSQAAQRDEMILRVNEAMKRLPEAQRQAIELQKLEGYTLAEIAERMGRSLTAVAGLLKRGLEELRKLTTELE